MKRICAWALVFLGALATSASAQPAATAAPGPEIELRGKLVRPPGNTNALSFKTAEGRSFPLLRTKLSEALFVDARILPKDLQLKGRVTATNSFDVTVIRTVKNGAVYDLYYWCNICSVQQVAPGECVCCREDVELVEVALGTKPPAPKGAGNSKSKAQSSK
jgi:hypothetical protein